MRERTLAIPEFGRIPPQDPLAEEAVLGACLIDGDAAMSIVGTLKPEMFYGSAHQHIFGAITELVQKGKPVDIITITSELKKQNTLEECGGITYVVDLSSKVVTAHNAEQHALLVRQKHIAREYLRLSMQMQNMVYEEVLDISDISEAVENEVFRISSQSQTKEPKRIDGCVDEILRNVARIIKNPHDLIGLPSGFKSVDRVTGGWQNGNLILIGARTRVGKTSVALALAQNAAILGHNVAFFSLEMSEMELTGRLLSNVSGFTNMEIRSGRVDYDKLVLTSENVAKLPILVDDTPQLSIPELRSKVKKLILKDKIEMIFVDYIQLMVGIGGSREQEVSSVSRGLKAIAKEFNIPVVALAQVNRESEARGDKRPQLAMLRESGSLEMDSDIVILLYRPALDNIQSMNLNGNELQTSGLMVFDIQKNRHGATWALPLFHNESLTQFADSRDEIGTPLF